MTTFNFRTLYINDQFNPVTGDFDILDARTVNGSVTLLGDTSQIPYVTLPLVPGDDELEIEADGNVIGSLVIDGVAIDGGDAALTSLSSVVWPDANGVQQSTTILLLLFENATPGNETTYIFVVGGTPLPEFANAGELSAFLDTVTSSGLPLLHDAGPGDTIDMTNVPGVTSSENDYILVNSFSSAATEIPGSSGSDVIDFTGLVDSYTFIDYADLSSGPINVTLDGTAETGSVVKTGVGTDSFVDLGAALESGWFTFTGGLAFAGTSQNDVFSVSVNEDWVEFVGGGGNDTYNLDLTNMGIVRLSYEFYNGQLAASGIVVNLVTGVVSNDGYGAADQINVTGGSGRVEINATRMTDSITGSDANERFILLGGNDTLDAGGGFDLVRYDRAGISAVNVNLAAGTATGSHNGVAFTHTLTDVEAIRGSRAGDDTLTGSSAGNQINAYGGNDLLTGGAGNDTIFGGAGTDTVVINALSTGVFVTEFSNGIQISSDDGADFIGFDVESFQFNDTTLTQLQVRALGQNTDDLIIIENDPVTGDQYFANGGNDTIDFVNITDGYTELLYNQLSSGPINVTIDAVANTGTIVKSGLGTDTLANVGNALSSGFNSATGGLFIVGTGFDDVFNITIDNSFIGLLGGAGSDSFNLNMANPGVVRVDFRADGNQWAPSGLNVNLSTGVVANDGFGGSDTINIATPGAGVLEIGGTRNTDTMIGSDRSERFITLGGDDTVDGGAGLDTVRYDRSGMAAVNVNLATGAATGTYQGAAFTQSLSNIEAIRGSRDGNDTITGNDANNILGGIGGNDVIFGGLGNDSLYGWEGNDTLYGGDGDDLLEGNEGADLMVGGNGSDTYIVDALDQITDGGGAGFDVAEVRDAGGINLSVGGWRGVERVIGFTGNDTIDATGAVNGQSLMGAGGDDVLTGAAFNDQLFGGAGNDVIYGGAGNDLLAGAAGVDSLYGGAGNETMVGGAGLDILDGGDGSDLYMMDDQDQINDTGTSGFDRVQINVASGLSLAVGGWTGIERVNGFTGNDTIDATGSNENQSLLGNDGNDQLIGGNANDQLIGGNGADIISGGLGNDLLIGNAGVDVMSGGAGNDTLIGGTGNDVLDGGEGNDLYMINDQDQINDSGATGFDRAQIGVTTGLSLAVGGWTGIERVNGLTGNDTIDATGSNENQSLLGNDGNDHLIGGNANDQLIGGNGNDRIDGWTGDDLLIGNAGIDSLYGGAGNDTLIGGAGNDVLDGGEGNDLYMVNDQDQINDTGAGGFDRVQIGVTTGLSLSIGGWSGIERVSGLSGNDTINATGAATPLTLDGGDGNDVLIGGSGNDSLFGGNGNDRLTGGAGNDFMVGGAGADVFVFATGFGNDVVNGFANGIDRIDLSGHAVMTGFGALTISQAGSHAVIGATGSTDTITVLDTNVALLGAEDFIFA